MTITYNDINTQIQTTLNGLLNLIDYYTNQLVFSPEDEELQEKVDVYSHAAKDLQMALESTDRKTVFLALNYIVCLFISFEADQFDASDTIFN